LRTKFIATLILVALCALSRWSLQNPAPETEDMFKAGLTEVQVLLAFFPLAFLVALVAGVRRAKGKIGWRYGVYVLAAIVLYFLSANILLTLLSPAFEMGELALLVALYVPQIALWLGFWWVLENPPRFVQRRA
jgi:type IV secretory pathway VirB2 component (pilin)